MTFVELLRTLLLRNQKAHCVLVKPAYYSPYPPLGLLKLSSLLKSKGYTTELLQYGQMPKTPPDLILVTSLFTYEWLNVAKAVNSYRSLCPDVPVILGGIYASLMPEHASQNLNVDYIWKGVIPEAEKVCPDYSLVPEWDSSIGFSSRGCIRRCPFCAVWKMEPVYNANNSIEHFINPKYSQIVLWDNNFLASPHRDRILDYLASYRNVSRKRVEVDFNQGLDARLVTPDTAKQLASLKTKTIRLAYDNLGDRTAIATAIENLANAGISKKKILVYMLFNYTDSPEDFMQRLNDLMGWGVAAYPMRYQPNNSLVKNEYVSPLWTSDKLNMVEKARRVLGTHGTFPPYEVLTSKFKSANSFQEAMTLREPLTKKGGLL